MPLSIWKRLKTGIIDFGAGLGLLAVTVNEVLHRYTIIESHII
jgi:16S rRNA G1207 methylase RsmC